MLNETFLFDPADICSRVHEVLFLGSIHLFLTIFESPFVATYGNWLTIQDKKSFDRSRGSSSKTSRL